MNWKEYNRHKNSYLKTKNQKGVYNENYKKL